MIPTLAVVTALLIAPLACTPKTASSNTDTTAQTNLANQTTTTDDSITNPWDAARARGIVFRAIGQEPGWIADVDTAGALHVIANYGSDTVATPPLRATVDTPSGRATYQSTTNAHTVTLQIKDVACHDAMSGEPMPYTVSLTLDTATWNGCGRLLDTRGLTNAYWKLTQIEGDTVATNQTREPYIRFTNTDSRFAGSTGCNRMSGHYTMSENHLTLSQAISTKMACLDSNVMRQEQRFLSALQTVDRFEITGDSLMLYQNDQLKLRFRAAYLR
jgi:heat shock protein HslJ/uncharacterized membrane protein